MHEMQAYPPGHPRGLVPEPKYHARDVFPNLLRPEDRKHFTEMKTYMRPLLESRLDTKLTWACQDSRAVRKLVSDVSEQYPMFAKYYQNNWPIRTYACKAFLSVRQRRQKGIQKITRAHWPSPADDHEVLELESEDSADRHTLTCTSKRREEPVRKSRSPCPRPRPPTIISHKANSPRADMPPRANIGHFRGSQNGPNSGIRT
ncbi:hypothetical protein FKP32DRAFT_711887 [Trametes sanguinea]|nr:hypothetical protein FKP32DRAFT_711887 [Trametes sanguinea]